MAAAPSQIVIHHVRKLAAAGNLHQAADAQLLHAFAAGHDQHAFALLLERHGPMVLAVCRHVLLNQHDAEDAFQATFLLLARKAAAIRKREALPAWLHGVAYRTAMKIKRDAARRRWREMQMPPRSVARPADELLWGEVQQALEEEIERLPAKYRAPFVLCCLENRSRAEAAQQLGWKEGTLSSRLAQARSRLQTRLARRGITLAAVLAGLSVAGNGQAAALTASLTDTIVRAALLVGSGKSAAGAVSLPVLTLARAVSKTMILKKSLLATALFLSVPVVLGGSLLVHRTIEAERPRMAAPADPRQLEPDIPDQYRDLPEDVQNALVRRPSKIIPDLFVDVTNRSGIRFTYRNGQEALQYAILESLGGGIGLIDYDGDGLLDIVVTGGGYYDVTDKQQIKGWGNRLYKNLGNGRFRDVTREAGLDKPLFYSHGCAVGDYDCDGWPDLLITGWGRMALYHNEPDGKGGRRFVEVTREAGLPEGLWTTSAAWADFDGDGFPDLYVCQYLNWSLDNNPKCGGYTARIPRDVCPPKQFTALPHHVFRNLGNGKFQDVSKEAGLRVPREEKDYDQLSYLSESGKETLHQADKGKDYGKGLGVVAVDVDGDGKPDVYVANDTVDNFLYMNKSIPGHIRFEEIGMPAGVARDERGIPNGSMGADAAAENGGRLPSLWCTNYENEMHALYRNAGNSVFLFSTPASGIAAIGQKYVGFGTGFFDIDNHGWEDLVISNGHVIRFPVQTGVQQQPVLLRNIGKGSYKAITEQGGPYFRTGHIGRGVALGDLDNDGRIDLVISHLNEPVAVLHNEADAGNHWLGIELVGKNHRELVGARAVLEAGDRTYTRFAKGGASYLSSSDRRLLFGIGKTERVERVTVFWPSGQEQQWEFSAQPIDRYWRLAEDKAAAEPPPWMKRRQ